MIRKQKMKKKYLVHPINAGKEDQEDEEKIG